MDVEETFKKLKPILGKDKLENLWLEYLIYPEHRREIEGIMKALEVKYLNENMEKKNILLIPPSKESTKGEYALGTVYYGNKPFWPFGIKEDEWIQHMAIFGRTGSGKTNVGFLIIKNLVEKNKPFLIFDWKRNYRDLLNLAPQQKELLVFTVGRDIAPFYFNPLIPPKGTLPTIWLKKLIEIMCHAYYLGEGVAFLLQKAIDSVFAEANIYEGSTDYPTLLDVKKWLLDYKARGREAQWMDSAIRAISTLCYGETGKVLNKRAPISIEDMLRKNVILELDALTNADKVFFIESLILWIHHYRLQEKSREKFKHAIFIEEAHHILLRKKQSKESIMDVILREIRELGGSIILLDQHPSLISIPSLGNTNCTIAMSLKHRLDVNAISHAILLEEDQKEYLGMLEVGWGVVRMQNRISSPFLVKFPHFNIRKGSITDEDLKKKMIGYSADSADILGEENKKEDILVIRSKDKIREEQNEITKDEESLLEDILKYPVSGIAKRYKRLSFSVYKGNKIRDSLVSSGLIKQYDISTFEGRIKFIDITTKGEEILRKLGYKIEKKREGGPEHEFWKHRIARFFRSKGYQIEIEKPIGEGRTVDIVVIKNAERIAIEIETGKSDVTKNILKNMHKEFSKIIVIPLDAKIARETSLKLKEFPSYSSPKIEIRNLRDLFKR